MPPGFDNRLGANWSMLLAIAELAGGETPELARAAAVKLTVDDAASIEVQLLAAIRKAFDGETELQPPLDRISSAELTARLTAETTAFCQQLGPAASMQELVLTGGGCNIPAVRDALMMAAQAAGGFVKTHAPNLRQEQANSPLIDRLDTATSRGASALGGASIYFEQGCY